MDYKDYKVEDFILDTHFREWILGETKEVNSFWNDWIQKYPEKSEVLNQARKILLQIPEEQHEISEEKIENIWNKIEHKIDDNQESKQAKLVPLNSHAVLESYQNSRSYKKQKKQNIIWRVAVILLVALGVSTYWVNHEYIQKSNSDSDSNELIVKRNPWGQKSHIFLTDGSEVVLNAGSTLKYNEYFNTDNRVLELDGEAYIKVEKDPDRPFIVKTSNMSTTALGTEFNVRAYEDEPASVVLIEGKVKVAMKKGNDKGWNDIILLPGEGIEYNNKQEPEKFKFNKKKFLSWKEGILFFQNAGEEEVYGKLEKWYGVNIINANESPKEWGYTGEFHNKSLETVLISLGFAMDFTYQIEKDHVKIRYN